VYFLTKCLDRSLGVNLAAEPVATRICDGVLHRQHMGAWHLLCFVVMPDHVHLLVALGERASVSDSVRRFAQFTASEINRVLGRRGRLWQPGFYEHAVRKAVEKCPALTDYIHQNPVRKGLCEVAEAWPWSTAHPRYDGAIESEWFW
jgi:REP element-mobilizing transposase RayT